MLCARSWSVGYFPSLWIIWVSSALLALLAVVCVVGVFKSMRPGVKGAWGAGCVLTLVALAGAYVTGFTFHLNTAAPVSTDRLVYLVPNCVCHPDANVHTELDAVRVRDGQIQWRYPLRRGGMGPSDAFISDERHVYVEQQSPDATQREFVVTALDARSGRQVWHVRDALGGGTFVSAAHGRLVLSTAQSTLILDAATGSELARVPVGYASIEGDGIVYACAGTEDASTLTATNEVTGHPVWSAHDVGCALAMTPQVLVAVGDGILTAIRVADGSLLWRADDGRWSSPPLVVGETVFTSAHAEPLVAGSGVTVARRISDGTLLWQHSGGTSPYLFTGGISPVLYDASANVVLVATDAANIALRASDGRQLWSFPTADGSPFPRNVVDGVVIWGYGRSRQIVALDLHTGSIYWQTTL